jgi:hypothetical protein
VLALAAALAAPAVAHAVRPTPHQLIDQALRPLHDQLGQLNATDAERRDVSDVLVRGEALAAELLEAQHNGATERAQSITHRIELLARLLRGRIEASRAEAQAGESERAALDAEAHRVQARAALERAAERRMALDREPPAAPPAQAPAASGAASSSSTPSAPAPAPSPATSPARPATSRPHAAPASSGSR